MGEVTKKLDDLVRVYEDLENTLKVLRQKGKGQVPLAQINVRKLILQLSRSKRVLERKISSTILRLKTGENKASSRGHREVAL